MNAIDSFDDDVAANSENVQSQRDGSDDSVILWLGKQEKTLEHINKGDQCLNEVNYRQSTVHYSKAIELGCKQASLFTNRAMCFLKTNYYAQAKLDCDSAINLNSKYLNAFCIRSICLFKLEKYVEAVADCNRAIEIDRNCVNAYYQRAVIFMKLNEKEKTEFDLKMVLRLEPNHLSAKRDLQILQNSMSNSNSVPPKHQCRYCKKLFIRRKILLIHVQRHTGKRNCKLGFTDENILNKQTTRSRSTDVIVGQEEKLNLECQRKFTNYKGLAVHQRYHTGCKASFCCSICNKELKSNYSLKRHMESHEKRTKSTSVDYAYPCLNCGETFNEQSALLFHNQANHADKSEFIKDGKYACNMCDQLFKSKAGLRCHYRKHVGENPFKCTICGKRFTYGSALYLHKKGVHREIFNPKPSHYVCSYCNQSYLNEKSLKTHLTRHQQQSDRPYNCDACGLMFERELTLRRHQLRCHYDSCPYCQQSFSSKDSLIYHVETVHNTHRKYEPRQSCPKCKKVLCITIVRKHLKYGCTCICDYCENEYSSKTSIAAHIAQMHFGVKRWICNVCKKRFDTKEYAENHLKCYHKKIPNLTPLIECLICLKKFRSQSDLSKHEDIYHSEKQVKPFKFLCDDCNNGSGFHTKSGLFNHVVTNHNATWVFQIPMA